MPLVFRQRWMIQLFHQRLGFQILNDRQGISLRHFHPWRQRPQPAQQQIAVEGAAGDANIIRPPCQFGDSCRIFGNHHPGHHIGVTIEVFGTGMQHQIGAQRQRVLQRRAQEGVVHHANCPGLTRQTTDFRNIHHPQQWITWAFHQHQLRFFRQRRPQRLLIILIDELDAIAAALRQAVEQTVAAAVAVVRRHQQIARFKEHRRHQQDRRHSGIGQHRAGAALQLR